MSTTATRLPLAHAESLATELVALLARSCARLEIAGSIRRRQPDVGDIELLAVPALTETPDMFGAVITPTDRLAASCGSLRAAGEIANAGAWGPKYKRFQFREAAVDLFTTTPPFWGIALAIRTGPATFSKRLVTSRRHGGLCPPWAQVRDGGLYHRQTGDPLPVPEEADVFALFGSPFIPPEERR